MAVKNLVTGAAGFIGAHVTRDLLRKGEEVVALDDLSGGFRDNLPAEAQFVEGSILDVELVNSLFEKHRFDHVFHIAAYAAEGLSHFIKRFNYTNNVVGSVNLINASVNYEVKCFVFTSSIAVYGSAQLPMTEDITPHPEDSYGIAKYAVEQELKVSSEMFGLNYIVFRPHNVYGEYQNIGDRYRNVIGIFMNQIMRDEPLTIFGDGTQTRAFSYIGGLSETIASSPHNERAYGEVFNIGADKAYSVNDLVDFISSAFGVKAKKRYLDARNEVLHAYSSHEKLREFFPPAQECGIEEGIGRMAKWAKAKGPRKSSEFGDIEIRKNLPPLWAE